MVVALEGNFSRHVFVPGKRDIFKIKFPGNLGNPGNLKNHLLEERNIKI